MVIKSPVVRSVIADNLSRTNPVFVLLAPADRERFIEEEAERLGQKGRSLMAAAGLRALKTSTRITPPPTTSGPLAELAERMEAERRAPPPVPQSTETVHRDVK